MVKKLNIILVILGISASIIGIIGFSQNNNTLLPIAAVLLIATGVIYLLSLFSQKKNENNEK